MFKSILLRFKWPILTATFFSILGALAGLGMLKIITTQLAALSESHHINWNDFALFVSAVLGVLLFGLGSRYLLAKLSAQVVYEFRDELARRLLCTQYATIERLGGHRILAAMKTDAAKLSDGLLIMPGFIYSFVTVLLCLGYLVFLSWQLFSVVFVLITAIVLLARLFLGIGLRHYRILRGHEDELFDGLTTLVNGAKELSINAKRRKFVYQSILLRNFADIKERSIKVSVLFTMLNSMASTLVFFVIGVIVFGAANYWPEISLNTIVSFVLTILYMINPLESVVGSLNQMSDFSASYRNIENLDLNNSSNFAIRIQNDANTVDIKQWNEIKISQLCFEYENSGLDDYHFSVGPITTQLKRGEAVYLTGGNGSGKSTFAKLLLGLYQATSGTISLDDKPIRQVDELQSYQGLCSAIFSDFHLFNHVLAPDGELAKDEDIVPFLQQLEMDNKVATHHGCFSSTALSQGQKKRLALVMSYIEDCPICLYDEWAADQDPRFRELFYTEIIPQLKRQNKLVLVITHDDKYFELADQLLRFESGHLVEDIRLSESKVNFDPIFA
ncbi:cyclic peptide export ABC transporter [Vibrio tritonius]|uniref:Cyclic peptide export ABC transporter n=1 Tax=Vibrio tritonius TaxID=1435069 RepID=A0ABS7YTU7_9VIBR|nr:cyclic peptide export ABC transporter [Vibrio tritonius]MCA2017854.1 cyclic peptide export ABC transporter [Vibrio tritonius]